MRIFKNWKSKKQLKYELELLKVAYEPPKTIFIERNIRKFKVRQLINDFEPAMTGVIKERLASELAEVLIKNNLIEWNIEPTNQYGANFLVGTIFIGEKR